jgi:predicted signal transduction protein with EAL and GGDEF domain
MRAADSALYAAKHAGRGRTASFDDAPATFVEEPINLT